MNRLLIKPTLVVTITAFLGIIPLSQISTAADSLSQKNTPMLKKRNRDERGLTQTDWLNSKHSFSFGSYYDPECTGFGPLHVINEDKVKPGAGFRTHKHNNMEIISYVIKGGLSHKDSMGNGSTIRPGDIQIMSAGSGVAHSEYNHDSKEEAHFLQIWIEPNVKNQTPNYQQKTFPPEDTHNTFRVVISPDGEDGSLLIKQDARMLSGKFDKGQTATFKTQPNRHYWLQMVKGSAEINGQKMSAGDGLAISNLEALIIKAISNTEILLFDLP